MSVIFFDVGQVDAALVTTPNGKNILIDAGPRGIGYDAGERIIAPNLRFLGISRLDVVVISHPHSDHLGGLPYLMRNFAVGEVWHNGHPYESALVAETIDRKSTRLNSSHVASSYAVFCLKKKKRQETRLSDVRNNRC